LGWGNNRATGNGVCHLGENTTGVRRAVADGSHLLSELPSFRAVPARRPAA